tara:strand:- start:43 stop:546 length:504 start_codon:yes stop_codon:yes gene_type:complete
MANKESYKFQSDVDAKNAYVKHLKSKGYKSVKIISAPADISAKKNGEVFYFEIKKTLKKDSYWGAASLTEWVAALENKSNYLFVIAKSLKNEEWKFTEYTPDEFMEFSTIPPFKFYFTVPLTEPKMQKFKLGTLNRSRRALAATEENILELKNIYKKLKLRQKNRGS